MLKIKVKYRNQLDVCGLWGYCFLQSLCASSKRGALIIIDSYLTN